jgi:hypothetical protein
MIETGTVLWMRLPVLLLAVIALVLGLSQRYRASRLNQIAEDYGTFD